MKTILFATFLALMMTAAVITTPAITPLPVAEAADDSPAPRRAPRAGWFQCTLWTLQLGRKIAECSLFSDESCEEAVAIARLIDQRCNQDSDSDGEMRPGIGW